ncbi:hypothetical protein HMPREF3202_01875 [Prevotella bivia]|uniref:Uncharacterized protein n=1 Tax=Prevotella bivia TaxID=28125 RepID=A0A137SS69_9BACT|nr:hypothetical protein HMPREF3202_01875 [Prevotella bivia]
MSLFYNVFVFLFLFIRERGTFSLSQMSRTELARVMPWREKEG